MELCRSFAKIEPSEFWTLGSQKEIFEGLRLFNSLSFKPVSLTDDGTGFVTTFKGLSLQTILRVDDGRIRSSCGCYDEKPNSPCCSHGIALAAFLFRVLADQRFTPEQPAIDGLKDRLGTIPMAINIIAETTTKKRGITKTKAAEIKKPATLARRSNLPLMKISMRGTDIYDIDFDPMRKSPSKAVIETIASTLPKQHLSLISTEFFRCIGRLVAEGSIEAEFLTEGNRKNISLNGKVVENNVSAGLYLNRKRKTVELRFLVDGQVEPSNSVLFEPCSLLRPNGTLIILPESDESRALFEIAEFWQEKTERSWNSPIKLDRFNDHKAPELDSEVWRNVTYFVDNKPFDFLNAKLEPIEITVELSPPHASNTHLLKLDIELKLREKRLREDIETAHLKRLIKSVCDERYFKKKDALEDLNDAIDFALTDGWGMELDLLEKESFNIIFNQFIDEDPETNPSIAEEYYAKEWIRILLTELTKTATICEESCFPFAGPDGFIKTAFPSSQLMGVVLTNVSPLSRKSLQRGFEQLFVQRSNLQQELPRYLDAADRMGFKLKIEGKPVDFMDLDLTVDVVEGSGLDWFELRPEVRCAEIDIPQDQWEHLIRGDLFLPGGDSLVVPRIGDPEAIERLRKLFGPVKQSEKKIRDGRHEPVQISRLQIFDLLEMRRTGMTVNLPPEVERVFQSLAQFSGIPETPLPKMGDVQLRNYQKAGFDWLVFLHRHRFGACLADDMGLGKTLQAIAFIRYVWETRENGSGIPICLIVVPPSLLFNWQSEFQRFAPDVRVSEYAGTGRDLAAALQADVVITTYDIMKRDIDKLAKTRFEITVFDEAQALKNLNAGRTRAALKLNRRFSICLTGTPMENHIGEYFSIMQLAVPGIFGSQAEFRDRTKGDDLTYLQRAKAFVLRRTKREMLSDLPPKIESEMVLDMSKEQKELYTRTVAEVREQILEAYRDMTQARAGIVALSALTKLRQICISPELLGKPVRQLPPKLEFLMEKLTELQDEGHSALVFSQFKRTLDLVEVEAAKHKFKLLRLDGSTPTAKRKQAVNEFQESSEPCFFLISLKAGGTGLNLTRAQYVFHLDPWWNPAVENQASDRAHRIGQQNRVFVQRLIMRHTVEEKIMLLKKEKQELFDAIVESGATDSKGVLPVTRDDFNFLLNP